MAGPGAVVKAVGQVGRQAVSLCGGVRKASRQAGRFCTLHQGGAAGQQASCECSVKRVGLAVRPASLKPYLGGTIVRQADLQAGCTPLRGHAKQARWQALCAMSERHHLPGGRQAVCWLIHPHQGGKHMVMGFC